ncbi:hypothetical protein [Micromonospora carbonacea]|uniref:DUF2637 domain-containing protein n=1 Tax=Micromonospora carbonacea TaxID=47853 RepID=A0A1C5AXG5_9ACTN|nr:hypothetical protein [Micromonospora carbonacea]SCF49919.1 hypothetical protein GA0070563_12476 [Micromonospora carbonacea]
MRPATIADRLESALLVLILLAVGGFAGAASFTHVHDWTMAHAPAGTGDWFGWANAVISELTPAAALLVIRRRRRRDPDASVLYPLTILIASVVLSLAAQIAVANDSFSSRLLSSVPALAFLALSKLVLTGHTTPTPTPVPEPAKPVNPIDLDDTDTTPATIDPTPAPVAPPAPEPVHVPAPAPVPSVPSVYVSSPMPPARTNGHVYAAGVIQ